VIGGIASVLVLVVAATMVLAACGRGEDAGGSTAIEPALTADEGDTVPDDTVVTDTFGAPSPDASPRPPERPSG
jgi:hypothetical protein